MEPTRRHAATTNDLKRCRVGKAAKRRAHLFAPSKNAWVRRFAPSPPYGLEHVLAAEMIYALPLPPYRRANVWLDEAPPADLVASSALTRLVKPKNVVDASRRIAAIEIMIPHGPMPSYALLGGELADADVDGLEVIVPVSPTGVPFAPSLAVESYGAYVGLPDEYVGAVFSGVEKLTDSIGLPTKAALRFRWAAHGPVGSSSFMFEKVSGLVVRLLTLPKDAGEKDVMALVESTDFSMRV